MGPPARGFGPPRGGRMPGPRGFGPRPPGPMGGRGGPRGMSGGGSRGRGMKRRGSDMMGGGAPKRGRGNIVNDFLLCFDFAQVWWNRGFFIF